MATGKTMMATTSRRALFVCEGGHRCQLSVGGGGKKKINKSIPTDWKSPEETRPRRNLAFFVVDAYRKHHPSNFLARRKSK